MEAARQPLDDREQLEWAERLAQEGIRSGGRGGLRRASVRPRQQDDGDSVRGGVLLQRPAELEPAPAGHVHVEDDDVGTVAPHGLGRGPGVPGFGQVALDGLECRSEKCPQTLVVVNEQYAHRTKTPCFASRPLYRARWPNSLG